MDCIRARSSTKVSRESKRFLKKSTDRLHPMCPEPRWAHCRQPSSRASGTTIRSSYYRYWLSLYQGSSSIRRASRPSLRELSTHLYSAWLSLRL